MFSSPNARMRSIYQEYPSQFWLLMMVTFIDRIGSALVFPFFSLYITAKFDVGLTEVGFVFLIFAVGGMISGTIGGALTDRFGRKGVVIFGLVISALSSLMMAFVDDLTMFYIVSGVVGLFADIGHPARQAMIADMLPEEKRADGFGLLRVVANLAITFGPIIGGLLAGYSFAILFIADAVSSLITAAIISVKLRETRPADDPNVAPESMAQTFRGYGKVFGDRIFLVFIVMYMLVSVTYVQMYSTLAVFLRDVHGFGAGGFGYIMGMNAGMVVLMQFWITRRVKPHPPMLIMALGAALYAVGFGMYGFVSAIPLFFIAMIVITIGEMVIMPISQAAVSRMAPENMRGRYMAVFGLGMGVVHGLAPLMAGLVIDNMNPYLLWIMGGALAGIAAMGYVWLHQRAAEPRPVLKTEMAGEVSA